MKIDETINYVKQVQVRDDKEYWMYRKKWHEVPKTHEITNFPLHLDIEINTSCNLYCPECPFHSRNGKMKVLDDYMPLDLYKKIIDEGAEHGLRAIKLNYRGEPLMHPNLVEMVKHAKDKGIIDILMNTNGLLLTPHVSRDLMLAGVSEIAISMDEYRQEEYERIRLGSKFQKVFLNTITCKLQRDVLKTPTKIRISRVNYPFNNGESSNEFIHKFAPYCDAIGFQQYYDYSKELDNHAISEYECAYPFQRMMILVDGTIETCCNGSHPGKYLGKFPEMSLYKAWHSKKFNQIRKLHEIHQTHLIPQCRACHMKNAFM